jgi:hypothetical protein
MRPSSFNNSIACSIDSPITSNSLFTSIRTAWKILLAGCPPLRLAGAGIPSLMISTSSPVVSIFLSILFFSINLAICFENFSSP